MNLSSTMAIYCTLCCTMYICFSSRGKNTSLKPPLKNHLPSSSFSPPYLSCSDWLAGWLVGYIHIYTLHIHQYCETISPVLFPNNNSFVTGTHRLWVRSFGHSTKDPVNFRCIARQLFPANAAPKLPKLPTP